MVLALRRCLGATAPPMAFRMNKKPRCPPRNRPPERQLAWRPCSLANPGAEAGAPGLGRGEGGAARLAAKLSPSQAPTSPGRRGRERGPAYWRAQRGRPGYPVDPAGLLEGERREGAVHSGLQPGLVPGPRAGPHNSPCPRRLEIKRLTRRVCPSRSDKQFQVRSRVVEEGSDFQVAEISRRELGGASPRHPLFRALATPTSGSVSPRLLPRGVAWSL